MFRFVVSLTPPDLVIDIIWGWGPIRLGFEVHGFIACSLIPNQSSSGSMAAALVEVTSFMKPTLYAKHYA